MRIDLHTHSYYSKDSCSTFDDIVRGVIRAGLGAIALTDHNELEGAFELQRYAPFPVIPGEEIKTACGDIIGLFLHERIPPGLTPMETIARIREQGGIVYVPHPFDRVRGSRIAGDALDAIVDHVDVLEVFNARNVLPHFNRRALTYAQQHGILAGAGSDAHSRAEYGRAYVDIPLDADGFRSPAKFLEALRQGVWRGRLSSPLVHLRTRYDVLRKQRSISPTVSRERATRA
jgi:predicted metal-dependent phosphoesterase TrpH